MYMFIYRPIRDAQLNGKKMKMLFFSFEMAAEVLYAKLLSMYIYETYGRVISYSDILSLSKTLSKEDFDLIVQCKSWLQEIEQHLTIIDSPVPPRGLYKITMDWLEQFGTWEKEKDANVRFIPNDPDMFLLGVVDHIRLLSNSSESTGVKGKIDEACDYMISLRNRTAMSWVVVQQLNRNFKSADRRNSEYNLLQLDDFSDSSGSVQAAEVVLGIYDPIREKRSTCEGYKVDKLKSINLKILQVLKNRFGESNKNVGLAFHAETGIWDELPKPNEIKYEDYEIEVEQDKKQVDNTTQTHYAFTL